MPLKDEAGDAGAGIGPAKGLAMSLLEAIPNRPFKWLLADIEFDFMTELCC